MVRFIGCCAKDKMVQIEHTTYLKQLTDEAYKEGFNKPLTRITPYINTIPPELEAQISRRSKYRKKN